MNTLTQLKVLQEQMLEELAQFPPYRAVKAMDQFINDLSAIYGGAPSGDSDENELRKQIAAAAESRNAPGPVAVSSPKVTPYVPTHRVA